MVYSFILGFVYARFFATPIDLSNGGLRERRLRLMILPSSGIHPD